MKKTTHLSYIVATLVATTSLFGANPPSSSDILRQAQPPKIQKESSTLPELKSGEYKPQIAADKGIKIGVKEFKISQNSVFKEKELLNLIEEYKGKELTLNELNEVASIITKYYRTSGYFVARAYIPAQELSKTDAVVEIAIIEGHYGGFSIKNSSLVDTPQVQGFMDKLQEGDIVSTLSLERQMLLIDELGGATVTNAEIFPGQKIGTSDFTITSEAESKYYGYAIADNYGSRYIGEYRLNVAGYVNSLSARGDVLGVSALTSNTAEMKNARTSYTTPLGYNGWKLDISLAYTTYKIGREFKNLDIKGNSTNFDLGLSYPLIKTRNHTLSSSATYRYQNSTDKDNYQEDRKKQTNSMTLSLNDTLNTLWLNKAGALQSSVSLRAGKLQLNDYAKTIDTIKANGSYSKLKASISQNQSLLPNLSLTASLSAQVALERNLDGTEDFSVGGAYGVRAYTNSELNGDQGYLTSLEFEYTLPTLQGLNHSLATFVDHARVWDNKESAAGVDPTSRLLSATGIGYNLTYKNFSLKASYAYGFGADKTPTADGDNTSLSRAFIQAMMRL